MHGRWISRLAATLPLVIIICRSCVAGSKQSPKNGMVCREDVLNDTFEGHAHISLLQDSIGVRFPRDTARLEQADTRNDAIINGVPSEPAYTYQEPTFGLEPSWDINAQSVPPAVMANAVEHDLETAAEEVQLAWSQLQAANAHAKLAVANAENYYALHKGNSGPSDNPASPLVALQLQQARKAPAPAPASDAAAPNCGTGTQPECTTFNRIITWDYRLSIPAGIGTWVAFGFAWTVFSGIFCTIVGLFTKAVCICQCAMVFGLIFLLYAMCNDWLDNGNLNMESLTKDMDSLKAKVQ